MVATLMIDLLAMAAAAAAPAPAQDCRAIADAAERLACYDARETAQRATPVDGAHVTPTYDTPRAMLQPPLPPQSAASTADIVRGDPSGRIATVTRLRHGLSRLTLDDGRVFDTATNIDAPPAVGTSVKLRRTVIGTTFLDAPGRSPITVRLVRQYR